MDRPTFRGIYPEFASCLDPQVDAMLAYAAQTLDAGVFGPDYDHAQGLVAAHFLTLAPGGQQARLAADGLKASAGWQQTTYGSQYLAIRNRVTTGMRVF